jgi:hypothetical protein
VGGAGKTLTALKVGRALTDGAIAVIDTEAGSAQLYADKIAQGFLVSALERAGPVELMAAMEEAKLTKARVLIIDSASAEWSGKGGCLEMVDSLGKFKGWAQVTPLHNAWLDAVRAWPGHVILTVRRKPDYQVSGSGVPKKIGLTYVQRDSFEYELDAVFDFEGEGLVIVAKSRLDAPLEQGATLKRADLPELIARAVTNGK